jgi:hypothetical protein
MNVLVAMGVAADGAERPMATGPGFVLAPDMIAGVECFLLATEV